MLQKGWIPIVELFVHGNYYRDQVDKEQRDFEVTCHTLQKFYIEILAQRTSATRRVYVYDASNIAINHTVVIDNPGRFAATSEEMNEISEAGLVVRLAHVRNQLELADSAKISNRRSGELLASAYWSLRHLLSVTTDALVKQVAQELIVLAEGKIAYSRAAHLSMWEHMDRQHLRWGRLPVFAGVATEAYVVQAA
jgi:hypothetical protein